LALLGKGVASAGEIAEMSRVPRSRTYDVLESLEKKGFAIVKLGKPVKYMGIKPKMVLEKIKNNIKKNAEDRVKSLADIKLTEEFVKLDAKKEVIICTNAEDINSKIKLFQQTIKTLQDAGIKIKVALSGDDELLAKISTIFGLRIKKIKIDTKFFIIDRKEILFYLSNDSNKEDIAVWINSNFFAQAFTSLFMKAINGSK